MPNRPVARRDLEAAFLVHRRCQERGDWDGLADCFAEDAAYFDAIHGWQHGRATIRSFLERVMRHSGRWEFPELWRVIDGERLVFHWAQRFSEPKPDGSWYEFRGFTALRYAGDGRWAEQMDVYDTANASAVLHEWALSRKAARKAEDGASSA